jgi:hypothetical protein
MLVLFALLFLLMMSLPPKKFDRYILPIFPVLDIVAAAGLVRVVALVSAALYRWLLIGLVALLAVGSVFWYHPYQLAYYNPLLGGGQTAARAMYVGWGEGLEQAGVYIKAQPDGCDYALAAWYELVILPYVCTPVMELAWATRPDAVNYVVLYRNQIQRDIYGDITRTMHERGSLVHTVRIHGIDYAYVYQLPYPDPYEVGASFGEAISLVSYDLDSSASAIRATGMLTLTTQWQAQAALTEDYMLFIHLLDAQGRRISQVDVPPARPSLPSGTWRTGHYYRRAHPVPVSTELPTGMYWLAIGLYRPEDGTRLSVQAPAQPDAPEYGTGALLLPVRIEATE